MKKLILLVSVFILALTANVFAQSVNQNVGVTANVNTELSLASTDVSFGDVNSGSVSYVNAGTGDSRNSENSSSPTAGSVTITADANASLQVSWGNATLTNAAGENPTTFTPTIVFGGSELTTSGGSNISLGTSTTTGTLNIGGQLDAITGGTTGNFSTSNTGGSPVVVTVQYNV